MDNKAIQIMPPFLGHCLPLKCTSAPKSNQCERCAELYYVGVRFSRIIYVSVIFNIVSVKAVLQKLSGFK